jgi:hypothetical protein
MAIPASIRLGTYGILFSIRAGATGEEYKARDTRPDCPGAIKGLRYDVTVTDAPDKARSKCVAHQVSSPTACLDISIHEHR